MNREIRKMIQRRGVRYWQVAEAIGISAETFSRWLRKELTPEQHDRVIAAIATFGEDGDD